MRKLYYPLHSLKEGNWFKLICGASFQDLPSVRSLTLAYTLAGADCIDVAADPAAIAAAKEALEVAKTFRDEAELKGFRREGTPWLMVSLNDGEDPHFRKAEFDAAQCPPLCPRPCERVCPAQAISFSSNFCGVIDRLCYGCGRCLPVCPSQLIFARSYVSTPATVASLIEQTVIDAIEIHTQVGHQENFSRIWQAIAPLSHRLKLLAISCPDGRDLIKYLHSLARLMSPLPCPLIWQTDGRPMSGDIGIGTTHAAINLAQKVLDARLPGHVQLAGGTNGHTVSKLRSLGLLKDGGETSNGGSREYQASHLSLSINDQLEPTTDELMTDSMPNPPYISGIAYGSYARASLAPILKQLETLNSNPSNSTFLNLEDCPQLLWQAVEVARTLVAQLKRATPTTELSHFDSTIGKPLPST